MSESSPKTTHVMENEWWNSLHPGEAEASKSKLSEEELAAIEEWKLQERKMDTLHLLDSLAREYPEDHSRRSVEFYSKDARGRFVSWYSDIMQKWDREANGVEETVRLLIDLLRSEGSEIPEEYTNGEFLSQERQSIDSQYGDCLDELLLDYMEYDSSEHREKIDICIARALKSLDSVLDENNEDDVRLRSDVLLRLSSLPANYSDEDVLPIVNDINDRVRRDWAEKITSIDQVTADGKYKLICSAHLHKFKVDDYIGNYFSCSLLTSEQNATYCDRGFGFILDPHGIVAAAPYDIGANNDSQNERYVAPFSNRQSSIPRLDSLPEIEQSEDFRQNGYSELLCPKSAVIGIFYKKITW